MHVSQRQAGDYYVFANDSVDGLYRQWRLLDRGGKAAIELVRELEVGSQAEGCAADDELGQLYIGEEDVGLWVYSAEPDGGEQRTAIDRRKAATSTRTWRASRSTTARTARAT